MSFATRSSPSLGRLVRLTNSLGNSRLFPVHFAAEHFSTTRPSHRSATTTTTQMPSALPQALEGLEPPALWEIFGQLSSIPRPSKHEERVLAWLKDFAQTHNLEWVQDEVGNTIIRRPGTGGGENASPIIIQGHVDMVTEKNADTVHDFMKDPIRLVREDDWITADGTTLGADNGIGVCTALAVLQLPATTKLPPIEALFTVDEETGLTGAFGLDGSLLKGRTMLNLDTEDWPEIFIGCAGGGDSVITLDLEKEAAPTGGVLVEIAVAGLLGGHSGLNINEDRGNAVKMAAITVEAVLQAAPGAKLVSLKGGDKRNAIPRECLALLILPTDQVDVVKSAVLQIESELKSEYSPKEPELSVTLHTSSSTSLATTVITSSDTTRLLTLILTLPHGVIKYSHSVPGLVETSTNLAAVRPLSSSDDSTTSKKVAYHIQCSTRSSLMPALERTRGTIRRVSGLCGAAVEQDEAYPGWTPEPDAEIVALTQHVIGQVAGKQPEVKAIHAGLECGIIGEKLPGCQSVSFGPTIRGAHSPDERVQISTVKPFWEATLKLLETLADKR